MTLIRIVLTVVFGWTIFKTVEMLVWQKSMDLLLLRGVDEEWAFWLLVPAIGILTVAALAYLWFPSAVLYRMAQTAVVISLLETITTGLVAASDPAAAKAAFVASRNARGLPVREEVLVLMEDPRSHYVPLILASALAALWLYLLFILERRRRQDEVAQNQTTVTPAFTDYR